MSVNLRLLPSGPGCCRSTLAPACLLALFGFLNSGAAVASPSQVAEDAPVTEQRLFPESFDAYARRYRDAKASGDPERIARMLELIKELRVERSVFQLHDVANGFVVHALADLEAGRVEDARASFALARELDPTLPTVFWGLAEAPDAGFLSRFTLRLQGWFAAGRSLWNRDFMLVGWMSLLFGAAFATSAVFAGCLVYRYASLLAHDVEERVPNLDPGLFPVLTVAIFVSPLILTFGLFWLVPLWMALTYGYQSRRERLVTLASLVMLAVLGPVASYQTQWARASLNPLYRASLSSIAGTFEPGNLVTLEQAVHTNPESRDLTMLLATQYKNLGEYEAAADEYRRLLDVDVRDLDARLGLGNIYFAQRDWDGAVAQYSEAIRLAPTDARAWYNKGLAHGENFQFGERETSRREAEAQNAALLAAHEKRTGSMAGPIAPQLGWLALQQRFLGLSEGFHSTVSSTDWLVGLLAGRGIRFLIGALFFAALIVLLQFLFTDRHLTQRCWKCATAFCGRCQIGTGRRGLCTQCYHLFHMKDGVSIEARNQKLQQVDSTQKRQGRIFRVLSVVVPGAGHLSHGATVVGVVLVSAWVVGLSTLVRGSVYALPDDLMGLGKGAGLLAVALMILAFGTANLLKPGAERG